MILALDLSSKSSGWAIFDNQKLVSYGCITASGTDLIKRINKIISQIDKILEENDIDTVVAEEVRIEKGIQTKTYRALMYLQAGLMFLLHDAYPKIKVEMVYPSSWRSKCGIRTGRGQTRDILKKKDIEFAINTYNITEPINDDTADAIGIGHAYVNDLDEGFDWSK